MENLLIHIGKSGTAVAAFFLVYYLLFKRQSHFQFSRLYLPGSFLLSFLIPLISFTTIQQIPIQTIQPAIYSSFAEVPDIPVSSIPVKEEIDLLMILFAIYLLGILVSLTHLIIGHLRAKAIIRKSRQDIKNGISFYISQENIHPFSFFNQIIVSEKVL